LALLTKLLRQLGVLRTMLALVLCILAALAPFALARTSYQGWAFVTTVIVPALVPIFFFVILLDILMSALFLSSSTGEQRARYCVVIRIELALWALLTLAWTPLFLQVLNPG